MEREFWNSTMVGLPGAHVLQTWEWGQVKARYGWIPHYLIWYPGATRVPKDKITEYSLVHETAARNEQPSELAPAGAEAAAAALVLERKIPLRGLAASLSVLYTPRGPLLRDWADGALMGRVLEDLQGLARRLGAIFIKIDPDLPCGYGIPGVPGAEGDPEGLAAVAALQQRGWMFSGEQVQFQNTVVIDLRPPEDALLAKMKQKTRYNIRLAERKGVTVRAGGAEDFSQLYQMYAETSVRDGFVIRDEAYYRAVWGSFLRPSSRSGVSTAERCRCEPEAVPLIAEVDGEAVAALVLFLFAGRAWYLYGMSRERRRELMPNYLLQWEAMRRAKAAGCEIYDLWGAPDRFDPQDSMWGVYRFKEGLGGRVVRLAGAWDYPARPFSYRLYTQTLPRLLDIMRRRGKDRTRQNLSV